VIQRGLVLRVPHDRRDLGDPFPGVDGVSGHPDPHERDPVAADLVAVVADADRNRDPQFVKARTSALVIAMQTAGEGGEVGIVEVAAGACGCVVQWCEVDVERLQVTGRPAFTEHGRELVVDRGDEASDGLRGGDGALHR